MISLPHLKIYDAIELPQKFTTIYVMKTRFDLYNVSNRSCDYHLWVHVNFLAGEINGCDGIRRYAQTHFVKNANRISHTHYLQSLISKHFLQENEILLIINSMTCILSFQQFLLKVHVPYVRGVVLIFVELQQVGRYCLGSLLDSTTHQELNLIIWSYEKIIMSMHRKYGSDFASESYRSRFVQHRLVTSHSSDSYV